MYNTQYLSENFEQRMLEKTILQHFPSNWKCVPDRPALIHEDGRKKNMKVLREDSQIDFAVP